MQLGYCAIPVFLVLAFAAFSQADDCFRQAMLKCDKLKTEKRCSEGWLASPGKCYHVVVRESILTEVLDYRRDEFKSPDFPDIKEEYIECSLMICGSSPVHRFHVTITDQYVKPEESRVQNCLFSTDVNSQCINNEKYSFETEDHKLAIQFTVKVKKPSEGGISGGIRGEYVQFDSRDGKSSIPVKDIVLPRRSVQDEKSSRSVNLTRLEELELRYLERKFGQRQSAEEDRSKSDFFDYSHNRCHLPLSVKSTSAPSGIYCHARFSFNTATGRCQKIYVSKAGALTCSRKKSNSFLDNRLCEQECSFPCLPPREDGYGDLLRTRYYYNASSNQCERFDYYGYGGNGNNFNAKEECEARCKLFFKDMEEIVTHSEKMESPELQRIVKQHLSSPQPQILPSDLEGE